MPRFRNSKFYYEKRYKKPNYGFQGFEFREFTSARTLSTMARAI
jgi:hypothetical protein